MRKIEVKIRQFLWALKKSFEPTTGDAVIFQGQEYFIKTSLTGENIWNLFDIGTKELIYSYIKGNDFKVIRSFSRFKRVFKHNLAFQKLNWGLIDCENPIGTRLSYNNSEDIYFYKQ